MPKNKLSPLKKTALVSALLLASGAHAATINVDGVICNLNDAVVAANTDAATGGCDAGAGADEIVLPTADSFNLTSSLVVESEVTLNANDSTIQPDPGLTAFPVIAVLNGGDLTINDATLSNGAQTFNIGGGVYAVESNLDINRSTISGNTSGGVGFRLSTGSVVDSNIINNTSNVGGSYYGAGLTVMTSTVTVSGSTISGNTNTASSEGGAGIQVSNYINYYVGGDTILDVVNTTISGNTSVTRGAGVFTYTRFGADLSVINLTNVTLAGNSSSAGEGGGLSNDGAIITLSQSLISGNSAASGGAEIDSSGGTITVDDYNLFGLNSASGVVGVTAGASDVIPTEVTLAEIIDVNLADNGGPTLTHALADNSPAIDAVPAANCASSNDQTGKARPLDGDNDTVADCDIGAFEKEGIDLDLIFEDGFES